MFSPFGTAEAHTPLSVGSLSMATGARTSFFGRLHPPAPRARRRAVTRRSPPRETARPGGQTPVNPCSTLVNSRLTCGRHAVERVRPTPVNRVGARAGRPPTFTNAHILTPVARSRALMSAHGPHLLHATNVYIPAPRKIARRLLDRPRAGALRPALAGYPRHNPSTTPPLRSGGGMAWWNHSAAMPRSSNMAARYWASSWEA